MSYEYFKDKIKKLLKDIKNKNIPEDPRYVENKIKALAESCSGKSSIPNEESFFEAMKKDISKYKYLEKDDLRKIRYFWRTAKQQIVNNDPPMKVWSISVNNKGVPRQYIPAVREFLGSVVEEREKPLLGRPSAKLPYDPEIKQGLIVTALTNLVFDYCDSYHRNKEWKLNEQILKCSLGQLIEQKRMAVMCTEVKCDKGSFPLLPLLFLNCKEPWVLGDIIEDFVPRIFDIKFQIKGEEKECDIIELLEKMRAFCDKFEGKDVDEKTAHASFFESLEKSTNVLRRIKENLIFRENTKQKLHESEERPSTSIHQVEREKLEQKQPLGIETLL